MYVEDRAVHDWYRFVLSYPPHLVREYVERFRLSSKDRVLDPFCGTGTTVVECKKLGIPSTGIEANPVACFASRVKTDWTPDPGELIEHARQLADRAFTRLSLQGTEDEPIFPNHNSGALELRTLPPETLKLLLRDSISPLPLHKTLVLLDCLSEYRDDHFYDHELLALSKALAYSISNLHFGPEVGVGPAKSDAAVVSTWLKGVHGIADDLQCVRRLSGVPVSIVAGDSRQILQLIEPESIDAIITSPPYPNEKDYTRTTRLESVLLGFIPDTVALKALKRNLLRSNTRNVYKGDDDDKWVEMHPEIQRIAQAIEDRRVALGKTSGFERLYAKVTKLYFGGMARHLADLRVILRPGAQLAYVVGDQASYLRVMIRTGQLLADIAGSLGYEVVGLDLFRTRLATAT
jgi:hypothetical protein